MLEQELDIESIINELKVLPLFNLSLSSKELFHSNFLAWICEIYPKILGVVFADYLEHDVSSCEISNVYREYKKIDLTLKYSHGETLIIENKVKSLPDLEQLKKYSLEHPNVNFLLLSLVEPNFS
ncbi:PD-(D/E)XK nuclease family protein [Anabaena sp. WFMT]|uniref:PD-(D/E)XK nuclease family protein n=1 Tax=Anabaena sp. WFMT TaxID=3449730 RepID=UPI003F26E460